MIYTRILRPGKVERIHLERKEIVKWQLAVAAGEVDLEVFETDRQMSLTHPAFPAIAIEVTNLLVLPFRLRYPGITLECLKQKGVPEEEDENAVEDRKAQRSEMMKKIEREQLRDLESPEMVALGRNAQQLALHLMN